MKFNLDVNNINYIKFVYKDADGFAHYVKASIKRLNDREIFVCSKYEDNVHIDTPQDIELSFACDNGLYKSNTELKFVEKDSPFVFFTIKTPENIEYHQNREYFRVKLNEDVLILYKTENEKPVNIKGEIYDLSANGVRITVDKNENISLPDIVQIVLYLSGKNIETQAKFIRAEDDEKCKRIAFNFIDLKESSADYISQICFKKQLENKRKNWI